MFSIHDSFSPSTVKKFISSMLPTTLLFHRDLSGKYEGKGKEEDGIRDQGKLSVDKKIKVKFVQWRKKGNEDSENCGFISGRDMCSVIMVGEETEGRFSEVGRDSS